MANVTSDEKMEEVWELIKLAYPLREIARRTGLHRNTVKRLYDGWRMAAMEWRGEMTLREIREEFLPLCACGKKVGHKGWCKYTIERSEKRKQYLAQFKK